MQQTLEKILEEYESTFKRWYSSLTPKDFSTQEDVDAFLTEMCISSKEAISRSFRND